MTDHSCEDGCSCGSTESTNIGYESNKDQYADSPFFDEIETLIDNFEGTTVYKSFQTIDQSLLTKNAIAINSFVAVQINNPSVDFKTIYPNLAERLEKLSYITTTELIDFYDYSYTNQHEFENYVLTRNPTLVLKDLEGFYSPQNMSETAMGAFCALVPNIFATLSTVKNIFSEIKDYGNDFSAILQKIQTGIDGFSVAASLDKLKAGILALVDTLIENIKNKKDNFTKSIRSFMGNSYTHNQGSSLERAANLAKKVEECTSESAKKSLKERIAGLISHAASTFQNLELEEIQFLILRFCDFIGEMEKVFDHMLRPLDDMQNSYLTSYTVLKNAGNVRTARAISAGAIRYDYETTDAGAATIRSTVSTRSGPSESGTGSAVTGITARPRRVDNVTPEEASIIMTDYTYDKVIAGTNFIKYAPGPQSNAEGSAGWNNVLLPEKVMLLRLAKTWGRQIRINSAWRTFGAPRSWHKSGQAFDLSITPSDHDEFALLAFEQGFGGFGSYPTFIHIDSRTPTTVYLRGTIRSL